MTAWGARGGLAGFCELLIGFAGFLKIVRAAGRDLGVLEGFVCVVEAFGASSWASAGSCRR